MSKPKFDVAASLNKPHFQQDTTELAPDPKVPTRIKVTLDQLVPYEDNPRLSENPRYEDIKESIRNRGLDHAPNITRPSSDLPYTVKDGGNTRLKILNELWVETGDTKFFELNCMFHPYTNPLDMLVGHMVENEARGEMLFIERAIAAKKIKEKIEVEESSTLSTRELSRRITAMGWSLNDSNLSQMLFANEILFPIIPNAFWNGLGRDGVKKLRKIIDTVKKFWEAVAKPEEGSFEDLWKNSLAQFDGDAFDLSAFQNQVEADIANYLDCPISGVRSEIQSIELGLSKDIHRPSHYVQIPVVTPSVPKTPTIDKNTKVTTSSSATSSSATNRVEAAEAPSSISLSSFSHDSNTLSALPPLASQRFGKLHSYSIAQLQDHAFGLALEYSFYWSFDELVVKAPESDFHPYHSGFILLPEDPNKLLNAESTAQWLYLYQLSSWFVLDQSNPQLQPASNKVPISFLGYETYFELIQSIVCWRANLLASSAVDDALKERLDVLEEIEYVVGVLMMRYKEGQ